MSGRVRPKGGRGHDRALARGISVMSGRVRPEGGRGMTEQPSRVAIVTGASRGIGLAVAQALVDRGDRVCITGRNAEPLAEAAAKLGADQAIFVAGKAHDAAHQDETVERTLATFGRLDYLV